MNEKLDATNEKIEKALKKLEEDRRKSFKKSDQMYQAIVDQLIKKGIKAESLENDLNIISAKYDAMPSAMENEKAKVEAQTAPVSKSADPTENDEESIDETDDDEFDNQEDGQ